MAIRIKSIVLDEKAKLATIEEESLNPNGTVKKNQKYQMDIRDFYNPAIRHAERLKRFGVPN